MGSPRVVDHVTKHVFRIALKKSERTPAAQKDAGQGNERLYVGQFYTRITGVASTEDVTLDAESIDDVARSAVFACILHKKNPLTMLCDAFVRCTQVKGQVEANKDPFGLPELSGDGKLLPGVQAQLRELLATINRVIITNSALLMVCPMFFNLEDFVAKQDLKKEPLDVADQTTRCKMINEVMVEAKNATYMQQMLDEMWQNDETAALGEMYSFFSKMRSDAVGRPIGEKPVTELSALTNICGSKLGASLVVMWLLKEDTAGITWRSSGIQREIATLLGRILSASPMNEEALETAKMTSPNAPTCKNAKNIRELNFRGKRDMASIRTSFAHLREDHETYIHMVSNLLKAILRTDFKTRTDFMAIIGQLVAYNATKRHLSRITHVEQPPITLDDTFKRRRIVMADSTFGASLNVMWLLLVLAEGITEQKVDSIDPNFCQIGFYAKKKTTISGSSENNIDESRIREMSEMRATLDTMIGFLSSSSAGMGDETQLMEALEKQHFDITESYNAKFITQIFWATLHGLGMLYQPCLQEFLKILIFTMEVAQNSADPMNDESLQDVVSHLYMWRCVMQHGKFLEALWHYINISLQFFIKCALSEMWEKASTTPSNLKGTSLCVQMVYSFASGKLGSPNEVPAKFIVLPVDFIDIILDVIKHISIVRLYASHVKPQDTDLLEFMDFELVMAACIFIMKADQSYIKNLTLKCDTVSSIILNLCKSMGVEKFGNSPGAKQHLVDALTNIFIASQRSDYNSRISCRLNVIHTLTKLFGIEVYKKSFVAHIIANKENFVQFMHLLLSDTTFIFEEVVTFLSEIRRRELAGITDEPQERTEQNEPSTSSGQSAQPRQEQREPQQPQREQDDDQSLDPSLQDGAIDPNQLKNMPFNELQDRTSNFVEYGSQITTLLYILCREFPTEITGTSVLLPQVASCLGCCLDNLAGKGCINLKVKNMMQYNFQPKNWLTSVVKCYVALYGGENPQNSEPFMKAVVSEGRYFKPSNFERAFKIITREMLLVSKDRHAFFNMSQKLCQYAKANNTLYENAMNAEMPDEFLDPIMMDIMEDPVLLPTSGIVMDRKNIERHLMSEATDPFSRQPLTKAQLVPQEELKQRIDAFLASVSRSTDITEDIYES
ncbi:U box domain containing protein, putative [Babesia bigemina]|uniref:RING-type E3 ubiquitin transferase n=1 Tax=Babesia bigemina TaxID=5866 RepID=A0A061D2V0_BABBI|nr:U box domain containing protein, putative [Babesia bigemina]CDR94407.1 U box domain containing protein, putative [Babesia bigemina]|eukprot:XP_012766593.1 U box domain containing protein, putative [Babesia bigemina]